MPYNFSLLQIVLATISLAFFVDGLFKFLKGVKSQTFLKFFVSSFVWGLAFLFSLFPSLPRIITLKLGFGENLNTLIFIGFLLVFMILFKIINIIEKIERNISEIVRKEALEKIRKNKYE